MIIIKSLKNNNINIKQFYTNNNEKNFDYLIYISIFLYKFKFNKINKKNIIYSCQNKIIIDIKKKKNIINFYGYSESIIIRGIITIIFLFFNNKNINIFKNKNNIIFIKYINNIKLLKNINKNNIILKIKNYIDNKINKYLI